MYIALLFQSLILFGIYFIVALGLNILWGLTKIVNIAHGDVMMVCAYLTYLFFLSYGISPIVSLFLSVAASGVLGLIIYFILLYKVLEKVEPEISLLIFWGIGYIIQGSVLSIFGGVEKAYEFLMIPVEFLGVSIMLNRIVAFVIAVVLSVAFSIFLYTTMLGKSLRACFQDKIAAVLVGINPKFLYILSFFISFGLAGLAGSLISMIYVLEPFMGTQYTMLAFTITVIGGLGEVKGNILGALILATTQTLVAYLLSPGLSIVFIYAILIFVLVVRPKGIFGR